MKGAQSLPRDSFPKPKVYWGSGRLDSVWFAYGRRMALVQTGAIRSWGLMGRTVERIDEGLMDNAALAEMLHAIPVFDFSGHFLGRHCKLNAGDRIFNFALGC